MNTLLNIRAFSLLLCVCACSFAPFTAGSDTSRPFALDRGVWIDPTHQTVVLMQPEGGVAAVNLANGTQVWSSDRGDEPIAMGDGVVFTRRDENATPGVLHIVAFDIRTGTELAVAQITLPQEMFATLDATPNVAFTVDGAYADGELSVRWSLDVNPTRKQHHVIHAPNTHVEGTALFQGARLNRNSRTADQPSARARRLWSVPELLPEQAPDAQPFGQQLAAMRVSAPGEIDVELYSLDDGTYQKRVTLQLTSGFDRRYPSADGRHFLASRRDANASKSDGYTWRLHDLESRDVVAELTTRGPAGRFALVDDTLLRVVRRGIPHSQVHDYRVSSYEILALELDGQIRWQRAYRDLSHRGQLLPPSISPPRLVQPSQTESTEGSATETTRPKGGA